MFKGLVGNETETTPATVKGVITELIDTLKDSTSSEEEIGSFLSQLDIQMDTVLAEISTVGARQNRVDLMSDRLGNQEVFSTRILSDNEDIDLERALIDLTAQESVLRASLSTSASIIQPTLMDFLR